VVGVKDWRCWSRQVNRIQIAVDVFATAFAIDYNWPRHLFYLNDGGSFCSSNNRFGYDLMLVEEERARTWEVKRGPPELGILLGAEVASSSSFDSFNNVIHVTFP
jgi:hypothetical protein